MNIPNPQSKASEIKSDVGDVVSLRIPVSGAADGGFVPVFNFDASVNPCVVPCAIVNQATDDFYERFKN